MEYLLMLMEYLLKQNQPSDHPPVNDGIDLLVEAIQNAPDIKSIKKKILYYSSSTQSVTKYTNKDLEVFTEDNISDSNKVSKEEFKLYNNDEGLTTAQHRAIVQDDNAEESTQIVYYKKIDDYDNHTVIYNEYDTTEYSVKKKLVNTEKKGFDKFESAIDETNRYEVFSSDLEDDEITLFVSSTERNKLTTVAVEEKSNTYIALQNYKLDDDVSKDKKQTLDWIEENFSREIREYAAENTSNSAIPSTFNTPIALIITTTNPSIESIDNISSITVELEDENKRKDKAAADQVFRKKQIEFLSYLDYGTERSDTDESESKEKVSEDSFPSYFVL